MTLQQNNHIEQVNLDSTQPHFNAKVKPTHTQTKSIGTLTRLKQQQKILANRITQLESRQRENERKQETRSKILVGAYFLDKARQMGQMNDLIEQLSTFLTRDSDRVLFGLPIEHSKVETK